MSHKLIAEIGEFRSGSFTSSSIEAIDCLTSPVLQYQTHIRGFDSFSSAARTVAVVDRQLASISRCSITQPDYQSGNQRIRALFARMIYERMTPCAQQRMPQPKFFKPYRGFAGTHRRERWAGIGPLHTVSLADAREHARKMRHQLLHGIDPLEAKENEKTERERKAALAANKRAFKECAEAYFTAVKDGWRNAKHAAQFPATMEKYVFPTLGDCYVDEIGIEQILEVLEQDTTNEVTGMSGLFWKVVPETARRVRGRIENVLNWATVRGYRTGENPARWKGFLSTQLTSRNKAFAPVKHHSALPFDELPTFMRDLRQREGVSARALEFLILTAARTGAVIGARWQEIDFKNKVWTVPPHRAGTKIEGHKARRVPLSDRAIALLHTLPREPDNQHVFVGLRHMGALSNMAMMQQLKRMGRGDITVHGFRSTFKDWVSEERNYPNQRFRGRALARRC